MKKLVSTLLSLTLVTFLGANVAVAAGTAHSKAPKGNGLVLFRTVRHL